IENAIDAGALSVDVVLKEAGSALIQIIDDGCGMSAEDARACFQRHATSKIRQIEDLERICTLGFRGEALASIAAVAQVELKTKRVTDEVGTRVRIDGGTVVAAEPCATPNGTSLAIKNLFYNVPARRNFLKSPATEFKHLVETFQFLALANPSVGFRLVHDENEVYRLTPSRSTDTFEALHHRIEELFGGRQGEDPVRVEETTSYLSVHGFVGRPEVHRRSRGEQYLFVNNRYVKNRYLEHAVATGYEGLLPDGAHPFFALFLTLDPRHTDVNVHPTKAEVKFDDERGVYGFLRTVIKKALGTADLTPQLSNKGGDRTSAPAGKAAERRWETASAQPRSFQPASTRWSTSFGEDAASVRTVAVPDVSPLRQSEVRPELPSRTSAASLGGLSEQLYGAPEESAGSAPSPGEEVLASGVKPDMDDEAVPDEPLLWQLHNRFILTQIRSGLMVMDQNAAHERILYEKALGSMDGGMGLSQQLLFPHTLDFSPADHALLKELLPDLRSLGFDIEPFSGRSVAVRGVPADIRAGDERSILENILEQFKTNRDRLQIKARDNLAKSIAHRSAIRRGAKLTAKEMRALIDQLFLCEMPYACPSGRPTMIKIPFEELDKRFGRG
ncbi:MAG: DNA mismatch repair endonuclease MutL, partial [Rhodothermales bacterium]